MTGTQALAGRAAISIVASITGILAARSQRFDDWEQRHFERRVIGAFVASRLLLFFLLFGVLRIAPRGDIPGFYTPEAAAVLAHQVPYRDFASSYAPLHAYMDAVPLRLWHSPLAIMVLAVLGEMLVLPLWFRLGREFLPRAAIRTAALLYLASPISLQYVTLDGQDTVLIAVLLAVAMLLLVWRRPIGSGAVVGFSVCLVKVIPLIFAPVFFLASPRRWPWGTALMALVGSVYGWLLLRRLPVLVPLQIESALRTTGNVPYLLESLTGWEVSSRVWDALTLLALVAVWTLVARTAHQATERARLRVIAFGSVAAALALVMFSKKSWPAYLMLVLFPLYGMFADRCRRRLWALAGFSLVVAVEHSVWSTLLLEIRSTALHRRVLAGDRLCALLLLLEVLLITGYAWLFRMALARVRRANADAAGAALGGVAGPGAVGRSGLRSVSS